MKLENKRGFNGNEIQDKEFSDGSGLELYDFNARTYDPQIGRFHQIDPETEEGDQESLSPYHFALNNPIRYNDPDGKNPLPQWLKAAYDYTKGRIQGAASVVTGGVTQQYQVAKTMVNYATNSQFRGQVNNAAKFAVNNPGTAAKNLGTNIKNSVVSTVKSATDPKNSTPGNAGNLVGKIEGTVGVAMLGNINPGNATKSVVGDLTSAETKAIQSVVNDAGRPLEVVGSAASGTRRGAGTDLPIGKGAGTKSDIDYIAPPSSLPYFDGLQGKLPSVDPKTGIIPGTANPNIGPSIRFEPK